MADRSSQNDSDSVISCKFSAPKQKNKEIELPVQLKPRNFGK